MEIKPQFTTGSYTIRPGEIGEGERIPALEDSTAVQPDTIVDTATASTAQGIVKNPLLMSASSSSAILNAAASTMSSPGLSIPLEEALQKLSEQNVTFFRTRGFYIPLLMKKTATITPDRMAQIMTQGSEKARSGIGAVVDGETVVNSFSENDARDLLAFKNIIKTIHIPNPDLAALLQKAAKDGITIEGEGDAKGAFAAYRNLVSTGPGEPVRLSRNGAEMAVISKDDLSDIPAIEMKISKMTSVLSSLSGDVEVFNLVTAPLDSTTIDERAQIAQRMLSHSRNDKPENTIKNLQDDWQFIREKSKNGMDFVSLGRLYADMLDANNDNQWRSDYRKGLELIVGRFQDHPDEMAAFNELLKRRIDIPTAAKIFSTLPQPVKSGDFEQAAALFHNDTNSYFYWDPEKVEFVMSPRGNSNLADRIDIALRLHRHCRDNNSIEKGWKNTKDEMENLTELSKGGIDFTAVGKLYVEMMDAINENNWRCDYREGLELIVRRFQDHPDETAAFNELLKRRIDIPTAAKIFSTLPQPVKSGDFEQAAALFHNDTNSYFYWDPEKVEFVMSPRGNSNLADRIDIALRLHRHCRDNNSIEKGWKNTKDEMENLTELSKGGIDFTAVGKLYVEMMDAINENNWRCDYREGLELIVSRFKDHPDETAAFNELLKRRIDIPTAAKIFSTLPQPVKPGDFEQAAALFHNDTNSYFYWDPEKVEFVMSPRGNSNLADRIDIALRLHRHCRDNNSIEKGWKNTKDEMENLTELSKGGIDFTAVGKLYVEMMDAINENNWRCDYREGLELIVSRFKDHPDETAAFNELLKRRIDIPTAAKILSTLPQPVKPGDFEQAAALFHNDMNSYFYWDPKLVELAASPVTGTSLRERIEILRSLGRLDRSNDDGDTSWKNIRNDYITLKEAAGTDFLRYADLFLRSLTLTSRTYRDESHTDTLNLITGDLAKDQEHWKIYEELLTHSKHLPYVNEAYSAILAPVQDETLSVRKDAAKMLMGPSFTELYKAACRNIPPGETVCDSASLIASLEEIRCSHSIKERQALFNRLLQVKGHLTGSSVGELVKYIDFEAPDKLTGIIEDLNSLKAAESFEKRKDIFVSFFRNYFNENKNYLDDARKQFTYIFRHLGESDSLTVASERFATLFNQIKVCADAKNTNPLTLTSDCTEFLEGNLKSGNFGECSREELYVTFKSILLVCAKLDDAKSQLIHYYQPSPDSTIEHSDDAVIIGGIKLDVKKQANP